MTSIKAETNPEICVVFGCSNVQSKTKGRLLHPIPFYGKSRSIKQKRRRKWVDFVKSKCAYWEPSKHTAVCSKNFTEEDYQYTNQFADDVVWRLKRDGICICVFSTRYTCCVLSNNAVDKPERKQSKQNVRYFSSSFVYCECFFHLLFIITCQAYRMLLQIQQLQPDLYLQVDRWHIPQVCLPSIFKFGKPTVL